MTTSQHLVAVGAKQPGREPKLGRHGQHRVSLQGFRVLGQEREREQGRGRGSWLLAVLWGLLISYKY